MVVWSTVFRNVLSNWTSYLVTAVVGFLLAPFILHQLGNTGYGLWTLVLSLTGYFGLLDLGVRSSVGRFVARHVTLGETEEVNRIVSTAVVVLGAAGALAFGATLIAVRYFFGSFHVGPQYESAARVAMVITGLNMGIVLPMGVFSSVLIALERYDVLSGIAVVSELCRAALVVFCLRSGYGIIGLGVVALIVTLGGYSAMLLFARKLYGALRIRLGYLNRITVRRLFGFGIYRFVWIVANQLIFYSDSLVIGVFLGASSVPPFAIAGTLINYGRNIASLVADTLYPAAARLDAMQDLEGLQRLFITGTRLMLLIALLLCLGFVFLGRQFIILWMGPEYAGSSVILMVLVIAQVGAIAQYASTLILSAMARHQALAYIALGEGVANLILSIVLVKRIGLIGAAWGTVIPDVICTAIVIPVYVLRVLDLSLRDYLVDGCLRPLAAAIPVAGLAFLVARNAERVTWGRLGSEVAVICGVFGLIAFFVCLDGPQRSALATRVFSYLHREPTVNEV
jgi:O-antigen/teichoic acid export membrane protein